MTSKLPSTFQKLVATKITTKFRESVVKKTVPMLQPGPKDVIIKNRYAGINASDINFTAGRYDSTMKPPFDVGFEGIGEVVSTGSECTHLLGQAVGYMKYGAFAEYVQLPFKQTIPLPDINAEYLPLIVSGLTAAVALDKIGEMKAGETVLVTAAAGGTGQFAVQLAKNAGCHVIGTCSSDEKVEFLKSLGCDRPINYQKENLLKTLQKEYPKGVDVIYESVGGETFDACVKNIALQGRLIVIGYITGYESESGFSPKNSALMTLPPRLLKQSASVRGFFLFHFASDLPAYLMKLIGLVSEGKIKSIVDNGRKVQPEGFKGLDSVSDAIQFLYSRKNQGKVIVEFPKVEAKL